MMPIEEDAKEIAERIFPQDLVESGSTERFKRDNNAGKRDVAEAVAHHFLEVLDRADTSRTVMKAFYRRQNNKEPDSCQVGHLQAHMRTALEAYIFALKDSLPKEGCIHEDGLRLCDKCQSEVNSL